MDVVIQLRRLGLQICIEEDVKDIINRIKLENLKLNDKDKKSKKELKELFEEHMCKN